MTCKVASLVGGATPIMPMIRTGILCSEEILDELNPTIAILRSARREIGMAVPGRLELPTFGLGNRCSIRLSYGTKSMLQAIKRVAFPTFPMSAFGG